jgi:hypothetical protein
VKKILEILSKLGVIKYGATAGTYKNETAPTEFEYMNMSGKKSAKAEESSDNTQYPQEQQQGSTGNIDSPLWMIIASWVLGALFWVAALDAFFGDDNLVGFWLMLAGLVTVHHTNKILSMVGVDLSQMWRIIVVLVCLFVVVVTI